MTATVPTVPTVPRTAASFDSAVAGTAIALLLLGLLVLVGLPLWALLSKSLYSGGVFVGLQNFVAYVTTPALFRSVGNSLAVAALTTLIVVPIAFAYAYALTRSTMPAKGLFYSTALVPLFAPSLLPAIALIYFFGNQGFLKSWMLGGTIYGPVGIVMAEVFYCFPHALTILIAALRLADARLYEAADALGASRTRIFFTVTLGGAKYGLISAAVVVFTLVITDFGIPKVIGGQFSVLATDVYKQVVGQQNFEMGAVVGVILLIPAVVAFFIDRIAQRRQVALLSARAIPYQPKPRAVARSRGARGLFCRFRHIPRRARDGGVGIVRHLLAVQLGSDAAPLYFRECKLERLAAFLQLAQGGSVYRRARDDGDFLRRVPHREDPPLSRPCGSSRISSPCCRWRCRVSCWASATSSSSTRRGIR